MSYQLYFALSLSLSKPITVPKGTLKEIMERIQLTEKELGYETEQVGTSNSKHWKRADVSTHPVFIGVVAGLTNEKFCEVAEGHNQFVRELYEDFARYSETPAIDGETITPEQSQEFWHGLQIIEVPASRWTGDYYRARMDALYEAMRGRDGEGMVFEARPLTPRQAADVINFLSSYLGDPDDLRLDVPRGCDYLASSADGGYEWCERCGAVTSEYAANCKRRKCPVK